MNFSSQATANLAILLNRQCTGASLPGEDLSAVVPPSPAVKSVGIAVDATAVVIPSHASASPAQGRRKTINLQRKSIFEVTNKVSSTQKLANSWHTKFRRKHQVVADELHGSTPYNHWLDDEHEPKAKLRTFKTIGHSPVDVPMFPARLTPVRFMSPSPPLPEALSQDTSTADGKERLQLSPTSAASGEQPGARFQHGPRSFSRQCHHVAMEQGRIEPFDVMSIYLDCNFFHSCSPGFVRDLLLAGGVQAWRGVSVPPHTDVYVEGNPGHSLFIIARGQAGIVDKSGVVTKEYGISDYFGEIQVLGINSRRLETVRAITYCQMLVTTQYTLTKMLKRTKEDELGEAADHTGIPKDARKGFAKKVSSIMERSLYPEERRHFESESVRIYKEFTGHTTEHTSCTQQPPVYGRGRRGTTIMKPPRGVHNGMEMMLESVTESKIRGAEQKAERARQEAVAKAAADENQEAFQARERLSAKVMNSIRVDMRKGFMMPADSSDANEKNQMNFAKPRSAVVKKRGVSKEQTPVITVVESEIAALATFGEPTDHPEDDDDEAFVQDNAAPLDPNCLPPLSLLSPVQKHGILRQIKHQNRARALNTLKADLKASIRDKRVSQRASREFVEESLSLTKRTSGMIWTDGKRVSRQPPAFVASSGGDEVSFQLAADSQSSL